MNKLLIICGSTATGKTSLALSTAYKFNGELISADSRQVYKYMNIITGKDLPVDAKWHTSNDGYGFYEIGKTRLWGYDLVRPDQEFSVKIYRDFVTNVLHDIYKRNKLPILVGGTGLFIQSIIESKQKIDIPRDYKLRQKYENLSADRLYTIYSSKNPQRALELNNSDRKNPRRLLRRLEIDKYEKKHGSVVNHSEDLDFDSVLKLGLKYSDKMKLNTVIDRRVDMRVGIKLQREIDYLKRKNYLDYVPKVTIGYKQWIGYLNAEITKDEALAHWKTAEHQYAKRQMTWFSKQSDIHWFEVDKVGYKESVENLVENWHNN